MLRHAFAPLIDLVYPPRCPLCGAGIAAQTGLCPDCWTMLDLPGEPSCTLCQRPFGNSVGEGGGICGPCAATPPRHDGIYAGTVYNDASRKLVLAFKHGGKIALADMMARLIAARLAVLEPPYVLVPVPLHRNRLWQRGYNQAALLARALSKREGATLLLDGLVRQRATPSLGGLGRGARAKALRGAIRLNKARQGGIAGAHVVLVDDVLTSGATSGECVEALKRGGAVSVSLACFARVLDPLP